MKLYTKLTGVSGAGHSVAVDVLEFIDPIQIELNDGSSILSGDVSRSKAISLMYVSELKSECTITSDTV